jgi:hypothetical protein
LVLRIRNTFLEKGVWVILCLVAGVYYFKPQKPAVIANNSFSAFFFFP